MNYEQKYKKSLECIQEILDSGSDNIKMSSLKPFFPELENKDVRVWKDLCAHFNQLPSNGYLIGSNTTTFEDVRVWLEKQGEPNPYSGTSFKYNGHIWGMCARDNGVEINFDGELKAFLSLDKSFIYPIHAQKSLAPKTAMEAIKEEKIDNANMVESKQKSDIEKGKWYVCNTPRYTDFVVGKAYYCPKNGMLKPNENEIARYVSRYCFHLWTIEDAKDGDVLVASDGSIFLFADVVDCACKYYVALTTDNYVKINKEAKGGYWETSRAVYPATKKQRDLLFTKMKEAGYVWDEEKKELKKIDIAR